jgi:hypothetical protein
VKTYLLLSSICCHLYLLLWGIWRGEMAYRLTEKGARTP